MKRNDKTGSVKQGNEQPLPIMEIIKKSWQAVHGTKRIFLTISAILVVVVCTTMLIESKMAGFTHYLMLTNLVIYIANFFGTVIPIIMGLSMVYVGIQRASNRRIQWEMIKHVFNFDLLWKVIFLDLLQLIIVFPLVVLFYGSLHFFDYFPKFESNIFFEFCRFSIFVVSFLVMIYLVMRLYITKAIVVAERTTPWKTVKASFKATKSHVWKLFALFIINTLIIAISSIPFGIGLIWSVPFCFINYGATYKKLMH